MKTSFKTLTSIQNPEAPTALLLRGLARQRRAVSCEGQVGLEVQKSAERSCWCWFVLSQRSDFQTSSRAHPSVHSGYTGQGRGARHAARVVAFPPRVSGTGLMVACVLRVRALQSEDSIWPSLGTSLPDSQLHRTHCSSASENRTVLATCLVKDSLVSAEGNSTEMGPACVCTAVHPICAAGKVLARKHAGDGLLYNMRQPPKLLPLCKQSDGRTDIDLGR